MRSLMTFAIVVMIGPFLAAAVDRAGFSASSAFCGGMFWMIAVSLVLNSRAARI